MLRPAIPNSRVSALVLAIMIGSSLLPGSVINSVPAHAEPTSWAKTYGGIDGDSIEMIQPTSDGGYIAVGFTGFFSVARDVLLLKLDESGGVEWRKSIRGSGFEDATLVKQTSDGGYIVAGATGDGFGAKAWILRFDSEGSLEWEKTYGGGWQFNSVIDIDPTGDGFIVTLTIGDATFPGLSIMKLGEDGSIEWQKSFSQSTRRGFVEHTSDGGFIVVASSASPDPDSGGMLLMKLESDGDTEWERTYGGGGRSIQQTSDGGFIVAGSRDLFPFGAPFTNQELWLVKTDIDGNIEWQKTYGTFDRESGFYVRQAEDGGYVVNGLSDIPIILKVDSDGDLEWHKSAPSLGAISNIDPMPDGGYVMAGSTDSFGVDDSDAFVIKLNSEGDIENCDADILVDISLVTTEPEISPQDVSSNVTNTSLNVEDKESEVADASIAALDICSSANQYSLDLFEDGNNPSDDQVELGQEVRAVAATNDGTVDEIRFIWNNPFDDPVRDVTVPIATGEDRFTPAEPFTWKLDALFIDGGVVIKRLAAAIHINPPSDDAIWDGEGDGSSWFDCQNWNDDECPGEFDKIILGSSAEVEINATEPVTIGSSNITPELIIENGASLTIVSSGINFEIVVSNSGTFVLKSDMSILVVPSFRNNLDGIIINDGSFDTCSSLINDGMIENGMDGGFFASCGNSLINAGTFNNHGHVGVGHEGDMGNRGVWNNFGFLLVGHDAVFGNSGTFINSEGATIRNDDPGALFVNQGIVENDGTIENDGSFLNECGSTFANKGEVVGDPIENEPCEPSNDCTNPTIVGTEDADEIEGTDGVDIIDGLGGDDTIYGLGGDDIICGGAGSDEIYGNGDNDSLFGQGGDDTVFGGHGRDSIVGGKGDDELNGGAGDDNVSGNGGDDIIKGSSGDDSLSGLDGVENNDSLDGGYGEDACESNPDSEVSCEI